MPLDSKLLVVDSSLGGLDDSSVVLSSVTVADVSPDSVTEVDVSTDSVNADSLLVSLGAGGRALAGSTGVVVFGGNATPFS